MTSEPQMRRDASIFDDRVLNLIDAWTKRVKLHTSSATAKVMELSTSMLSEDASQTLKRFQTLYFSTSAELDQTKISINREVDSLIDQATAMLASGAIDPMQVSDSAMKEGRLGLAAVQKELEALVTIEIGMRDKIMPLLNSMQFEDAMRQRLDHISSGWQKLLQVDPGERIADVKAGILKSLSSNSERLSFYNRVLHEPAPAEATAEDIGISGLF